MKLFYPIFALGLLSLTACGESKQETQTTVAQTDTGSEVVAQSGTDNTAPTENGTNKSNSAKADKSKGNVEYFDLATLNEPQDEFAAYIKVAQYQRYGRLFTDEDLLNTFSSEYRNESNGFKKQEIAERDLPQIKEKIAQHDRDYIIRVPFTEQKNSNGKVETRISQDITDKINIHVIPSSISGNYDFETKSFPIDHPPEADFFRAGFESINLSLIANEDHKQLVVTDESVARVIEELYTNRSNGELLGARGYIDLEIILDQTVPIHASVEYFNLETGETLATKEFNWEPVDKSAIQVQ